MSRNIQLLGPLSITEDARPSALLGNAKGCALLAYLIVRERTETREHLSDLLWDSADTSTSLRNLRVLLTRIRPHLPGLRTTRKAVRYDPEPAEAIDYLILTEKLSCKDSTITLDDLRLYRGDLLDDIYLKDAPRFMEWLTVERERLRRSVLDAHRILCQSLSDEKRWEEGVEAADHWLSIDPLDEEALRWQIQFLAASGQVPSALKAYEAFKKHLWDRLGLEPEEITQALARELGDWSGEINILSLPDLISLNALSSGELSEPGPLPANTILPYHRNEDFVGRESDLLQIASAFGEVSEDGRPPVVVVTGIGGMGKTQTTVEFCYRYGRYFPGGVFWLNFNDAEQVPGEVAAVGSERGLGLFREADALTLNDQVGRVQRAFQESTPRLLIFDNCEEEALLKKWLPVTGGCRILLTSRQDATEWGKDVRTIPLTVLDPMQSAELLQRLVPHISKAEALGIAEEVGHLPLALHLAGGFLHHYQQIKPTTYLQQLQEKGVLRHPSLQGHGISYSPTGHELSVARTYAINWERLDPANQVNATARKLLACAACLAPSEPIPTEWLKGTQCGDGDDNLNMNLQAEDGLAQLVALGFLNRGPGGTVVLHPLLASFTQEVSSVEERDAAQIKVASLLTRTLSDHYQKEGHLSNLPVSAVHLRHVSEIALSLKVPPASDLATLFGLHLMNIGERLEAEPVLERAHAAAVETGDVPSQAYALMALSSVQESLGQDDKSLRNAQEAVELFKKTDSSDPAGLAEALYNQGWAYFRLGQAEKALSTAREGYKLSHNTNLQLTSGHFLNLMGVVNYYMLGKYNIANKNLETALTAYREAGYRKGESAVLNNIGENARLQGNFAAAARCYEEAVTIAHETENQNKEDIFLSNLCGARIRLGQFEKAAIDLEKLIAKIGHDWYGLSEAYRFLGEAYLGLGKTTQALDVTQQALALANPSNLFEHGRAWRVLGIIAAQLNEPIQSDVEDIQLYGTTDCFRRSLDFFRDGKFERDRAITLWYWARYELKSGNRKEGEAMWQEARDIFTRLHLPLMVNRMMETNTEA